MRLGLTYDLQRDAEDERQAEFDPPRVVEAVRKALHDLGHQVALLGAAEDLVRTPPSPDALDLVFNLAEGRFGRCREAWVPTLLDLYRIPYVGSDALALSLGLDKVLCKRLAVVAGLATPPWLSITHPRDLPAVLPLAFPVIVKPRAQGSGIGIDAGAVVEDRAALVRRAAWLYDRWPEPLLIETFIPSGELTVCVIGNDPPIAYPAIQRPLDPTTRLSCHVVRTCEGRWEAPVELSETLDFEARRIAVVMFEALGCHDVARVDLRVEETGRPLFLEINPLPSFDPEGSFGLLAEHLGLTYPQLIGRVVEAARARLPRGRTPPVPSAVRS